MYHTSKSNAQVKLLTRHLDDTNCMHQMILCISCLVLTVSELSFTSQVKSLGLCRLGNLQIIDNLESTCENQDTFENCGPLNYAFKEPTTHKGVWEF